MTKQECITSSTLEYLLLEQSLVFEHWSVYGASELDKLEALREQEGIRGGEHVVLRRKHFRLHKVLSRFSHKQPDGSEAFFAWVEITTDPATYEVEREWIWTGKQWR